MTEKAKSILIWSLFLASFFWLLKALFLGFYPDFSVYYDSSKYFLSGQNLYEGSKMFTSFVYPPEVLLLFLPFTFLNFQTAEIIWIILSLVMFFCSLFLLSKVFEEKLFSKLNLILMALSFVSFPVKFTLGMGQINMMILLLLTLCLYFLKHEKEFLSGIFLGLSLVIKLFPSLLPFYFLFKLQKMVLLGIFVSLLVTLVLVLVFVPHDIYLYFFQKVAPSLLPSWQTDYYNQSLGGFIGRSFGTGEFSVIIKFLVSAVIVFLTFFAAFKNKKKDFLTMSTKFSIFITANLLINVFSWQHHFVWLVIPFYAVFFYLKKNKILSKYLGILIISYFLVSINFANPKLLPVIFQSHVFFGAVILFLIELKVLFDKE
jgi:alpha-1,2-mannosyltransferase